MMERIPYLHFKKDKKDLVKSYYIALIPLLLFGLYKNGIILYQNDFISFGDLFIPLYFYFISIFIGLIVALIRKDSKKEWMLVALILSCTVSINTSLVLYPLVLFVSLFISSYLKDKYSFNFVSLTRVMLLLALFVQSYSYLNVAEKIEAFNYSLFDSFWGYGVSGIANGSLFCLLIGFIFLAFNRFYKRVIPIMASISFVLIFLVMFLITKNTTYLESILNGTVYFAFVFVAADIMVSPDTKWGMALYGVVIGLLTGILCLFLPLDEAPYLSIFFTSLAIPFFNKIAHKKYLHR